MLLLVTEVMEGLELGRHLVTFLLEGLTVTVATKGKVHLKVSTENQ